MDFKKYPLLTATVGLLGLICVGGVGLVAWQTYKYDQNKKSLDGADRKLATLLESAIAPSEENVELANKALASAKALEGAIFKDLQGKKDLYIEYTNGAAPLQTELKQAAQDLMKDLTAAKIKVLPAQDFGFGFARYVQKNSPIENGFSDIATQNNIIKELVKMLIASKDENAPVALQAIQREPVELATNAQNLSRTQRAQQSSTDEFRPGPLETLRKDGILRTFYFKIKFTARTDVFRKFVNAINDTGYPLVIRGIEVAPAQPEALSSPSDGGMGMPAMPGDFAVAPPPFAGMLPPADGAPAAPEMPVSQVIIRDDPSEYTISLEYLIPVKPAPEPAAESGK